MKRPTAWCPRTRRVVADVMPCPGCGARSHAFLGDGASVERRALWWLEIVRVAEGSHIYPHQSTGWGTCVAWDRGIIARIPGKVRAEAQAIAERVAYAPKLILDLFHEVRHLRERVAELEVLARYTRPSLDARPS